MDLPDNGLASNRPPPPRLPGVWSGLVTVVLYLVLQLVVALVLGLLLAVGYGLVEGMRGHTVDSATMLHLAHMPNVQTGLTVVVMLVVAVISLWLIRWVWPTLWRRADPPGFGLVMPDEKRFFAYAVVLAVGVAFMGGLLTQLLAHGHTLHQDVTVMGRQVSPGVRIALAVLVVCVAPVVEELIFRGVLLSGLLRRMRAGWAIVISALIFGCAHLPDFKFVWYAIPTLVILGLVLAWLRLRTRSLWPSITMHATNNLIATIGWFAVTHPPHG